MKHILIIACLMLFSNPTTNISKLSDYLKAKKDIEINDYQNIVIISSTGCPVCNNKLDKTFSETPNKNWLIIYSVNSMENYIYRNLPDTYYIKENLSMMFFKRFESIFIYKEANEFKYMPIIPDNVDTVLNLYNNSKE